jgi:hypothetical protein
VLGAALASEEDDNDHDAGFDEEDDEIALDQEVRIFIQRH